MKPEQWDKVEQVFHAAVQRAPTERAAFLDAACGEDQKLRQEVESLLTHDETAQSFLTQSPDVFVAGLIATLPNHSLIGTTFRHYEILAPLGRGGMGEVFLALDRELGRKVALKLLPAHWTSDAERLRRFKQEARAASALNHPNILTIHEIGHAADRHFIVSEFVEGETVRQRMHRGPMTPDTALEIASQVASALEAAHRAGIIHRDIKPENVMVRPDGLVKVLDFGLAKLSEPIPAATDTADGHSVTEQGRIVGTPHYMSPEQARGVTVDGRSDIFSLGVVLYEMIAGRPPFQGATATDVIVSIVQNEPDPLRNLAPEAPAQLESIVARTLRKNPEERYQTAAALLSDLKALRQPVSIENGPPASRGIPSRQTQQWRKLSLLVAMAGLLLVAGWFWLSRPKAETTESVIAVLPFKNLSAEPESEYFVDGLTDEIIRNLSLIEGLQVRSRTSSFAFKDKPHNIRDFGKQLNVNFVLDGSVLRSAGNLRVNVQFVRVSDDVPLWSGRFDRELKDIFTIQDEISRSVVNELRLKLGRGARRYDTNIETYELYLKARSLIHPSLVPFRVKSQSVELFEQVITRDPAFAPAYAGLAEAYAGLSSPLGQLGRPGVDEAFEKMRPAAEKALQLDPLLAEAHGAMGQVHVREFDWASAEKSFRRAIELNPSLPSPHILLALYLLAPAGRLEEALQEIDKAIRADPLSPDPWEQRAFILVNAGRPDEALESCRRALILDPENILVKQYQARALLQKGRAAEAFAVFEQLGGGALAQRGYAYGVTGQRAEAEVDLDVARTRNPSALVWIYAGLGDKDRVFEALEAMAARKDPRLRLYLGFPEFALIRSDPRLAAFRKKAGLQ